MKKGLVVLLSAVCLLGMLLSAFAQDKNRAKDLPLETNSQVSNKSFTPDGIIKQFTAKESELREVFKDYSYLQESRLQVLGPANVISGEFYQVSEFVFNDAGKRIERIIRAPQSTLDQAGLTMTQEDKNAFINLQPFALASEDLPNYNVNYVGKEKIDELNTYVFDVIPKAMSNTREMDRMRKQKIEGKYFQGRIWVDDQDLQIVKTAGKIVPEFQQRFPKFETYRENIDGRYWFPTYTYGDDTLEFERFRVHVRMVIKYKNYRQFQSDVKITGVDEIIDDSKAPPEENKSGTTQDAKKDETKKEDASKSKPQRPRP
jgi:hypothetical protein